MAYVIAEPCIGTKDTACVDACPVDCIHPKKNTSYDDGRPTFEAVPQLYIDPVKCIDCGVLLSLLGQVVERENCGHRTSSLLVFGLELDPIPQFKTAKLGEFLEARF